MRFCEANFLDAHAALAAEFREWAGLRSEADSGAADTSDVCILPPDQIVAQANAAEEKLKILNTAYKAGPDALDGMGLPELRSLCKLHGISPKRTKAEMVGILNSAKPGTDWESVSYQGVVDAMAGVQSITYTKPELVKKLSDKWYSEKQKAVVDEVFDAANATPATGLNGMTIEDLRELAKQEGISVNITKQDVIDSLNGDNPSVDHSALSGAELAKKQKELFGASTKKNKSLLIKALEKAAGEKMAQQAIQQAQEAAINKAKEAAVVAVGSIVIPQSPLQWQGFLKQISDAKTLLNSNASILSEQDLKSYSDAIGAKLIAFKQTLEGMSSKELQQIGKETKIKLWNWIPKDKMIVIMTESETAITDQIILEYSEKAKLNNQKHSSKSKTILKKVESTPKIVPGEPKSRQYWEALDVSWSERGAPKNFTYEKNAADAGGVHEKEFWTDADGARWMFKPVKEPFLAHAEEMAYRLGRHVDPDCIEVRTISLGGRFGTIQKMKTGLASPHDLSWTLTEDGFPLPPALLEQLQREHVIDWFISNHDTHAQQFILQNGGRLFGVDKGQAGKFLGRSDEKLKIGYDPNHNYGSLQSIYDRMFGAAKAGKTSLNPEAALPYIQAVERLSDAEYESEMMGYAMSLHKGDRLKVRQFLDRCLERKHRIRADFESFYSDVTGKKFRFEQQPQDGSREYARFIESIDDLPEVGFQGKIIKVDRSDFEDQSLLAYQEKDPSGNIRTVLLGKLHGTASIEMKKVLEALASGAPLTKEGLAAIQFEQECGTIFDSILPAIKTINHHKGKGDTKYSASKLANAFAAESAIDKLSKAHPDNANATKYYKNLIEKIKMAANDPNAPWDTAEQYKAFVPNKIIPKKKDANNNDNLPTVSKTDKLFIKSEVVGGQLVSKEDDVGINQIIHVSASGFKGEFVDGTSFTFVPEGSNPHAIANQIRVSIPGAPTPQAVQSALDRIKGMGVVDTDLSTEDDEELLYLTKLAAIRRMDMKQQHIDGSGNVAPSPGSGLQQNPLIRETQEWVSLMAGLDGRNASTQERLAALKQYWEKQLGHPVDSRQSYDPKGVQMDAHLARGKKKAGADRQFRPDISEDELAREMDGYTLYHSTDGVGRDSGKGNMLALFSAALPNNGLLISTTEKIRLGIPLNGASPTSDMETGGASYVFTRIQKVSQDARKTQPGLYLKPAILRRMDAITYAGDQYGETTRSTISKKRLCGIEGWKRAAQHTWSNETIFKDSVSLVEDLDLVVTANQAFRKKILDEFKKAGITHMFDGRRVEDVVVAKI